MRFELVIFTILILPITNMAQLIDTFTILLRLSKILQVSDNFTCTRI